MPVASSSGAPPAQQHPAQPESFSSSNPFAPGSDAFSASNPFAPSAPAQMSYAPAGGGASAYQHDPLGLNAARPAYAAPPGQMPAASAPYGHAAGADPAPPSYSQSFAAPPPPSYEEAIFAPPPPSYQAAASAPPPPSYEHAAELSAAALHVRHDAPLLPLRRPPPLPPGATSDFDRSQPVNFPAAVRAVAAAKALRRDENPNSIGVEMRMPPLQPKTCSALRVMAAGCGSLFAGPAGAEQLATMLQWAKPDARPGCPAHGRPAKHEDWDSTACGVLSCIEDVSSPVCEMALDEPNGSLFTAHADGKVCKCVRMPKQPVNLN